MTTPVSRIAVVAAAAAAVNTHLAVEVEEAILTVDVPEGSKALDRAVHTHGVVTQLATHCHEHPVRVRPTDEHL